MRERLVHMKNELNHLSEEVFAVDKEESELIDARGELHFLFQ